MRGLADWLKAEPGDGDDGLRPRRRALLADAAGDRDGRPRPLDRLEALGREDLARNEAALAQACARYLPGASVRACFDKAAADKPKDGPVAAARLQVPMLRAFVETHQIVGIPGTEQALVAQAPPYNAQNAAYIDPAGPFDRNLPSIYYIAPPDPRWSQRPSRRPISPARGACCSPPCTR